MKITTTYGFTDEDFKVLETIIKFNKPDFAIDYKKAKDKAIELNMESIVDTIERIAYCNEEINKTTKRRNSLIESLPKEVQELMKKCQKQN